MDRRRFIALSGAAAFLPSVAFAQQAARMPRVAIVSPQPTSEMTLASAVPLWAALFQGLADQGFVEGRTITFDRYAIPGAAAQEDAVRAILGTNPDLICISASSTISEAAFALNKTIPMVYVGTESSLAQGVSNFA